MNEFKGTPGPWHWEADEVMGDPFGRIRYQVTTTGKTITQIYYSSFEGEPTNAEYDARLIASAPDLLAMLEKCSDALENAAYTIIVDALGSDKAPTFEKLTCKYQHIVSEAHDLIEKATGVKP